MGVGVARAKYDLVGIDVGLSELSAAANVAVGGDSRTSSGVGVGGKVIDAPNQWSHRR